MNSDYEGHSSFLHKCIADAVETGVEIRFLPGKRLRSASGRIVGEGFAPGASGFVVKRLVESYGVRPGL